MKENQTAAARRAEHAMISAILESVIEPVRAVARIHGYAICIHGSLARDIDLVAVPWTEAAHDPVVLVQDIRAVISSVLGSCYVMKSDIDVGGTMKPHGRRAFTLSHQLGGSWFDLSVMPRIEKTETEQ